MEQAQSTDGTDPAPLGPKVQSMAYSSLIRMSSQPDRAASAKPSTNPTVLG